MKSCDNIFIKGVVKYIMGNVSEIRIFISSTFRDLKDERDYLMNVIFPELIRITRERGLTFTPIDLRWGIPDESFIFKVIKTCFDEIDRARPHFIGIIGERYGYVPSEDKDANLNLQVIDNEEIKRKLDEYTKNNLSITQMEMEYGVFSEPKNAQFSYFYFKKGENKNERINRLKDKIRVDNSPWHWSRKEFDSTEELGEQIKNDYMAMLDANFPKVELRPLDIERRINREYSEYILKDYLPDEKTISDIIEELDKNRKILVTGEVGIGKSSALAYIARKYEKEHQGALVIEHYFGATENYTSRDIAIRMLNEIKDRLEKRKADTEGLEIPKDELEIFNKIGQWITKLPNWEDTLLIVDGTDQVDEIENLRFLAYLPNIKVIASARANTEAYRYALDDLNYERIELKPLNDERKERIIKDFLERHGKRLTEEQLDLIVNAEQTSNPLYLRILLEEILRIGELRDESSKESQDEFIKKQIQKYLRKDNRDLELKDLYGLVIERIEKVLKKYFNADASDLINFLRTIAVSRNGLSQYEIEQITNIKPLYFSIIRNNLDYHIASKNGLLDFFHYSLKEYVYENYLQKNEEEKKTRTSIVNYFEDKETDERKIYEFPYQLYNLNDREGMKKALKDSKWLLIATENMNSSRYFDLIEYIRFAYGDTCIGIKESFTEEIPEEPSEKSNYLMDIGNLYDFNGCYREAEPLFKQSLEIRRKIYGEYHPNVATSLNNLALLYYEESKYNEAEPLYKQALEIIKKIHGEYHPNVATSLNNLAELYLKKGRYDEAEPLFKQSLEIFRKIYGEYHPNVATSLNNLALLYYEEGKYGEAEPLFKQSLEINRKIHGEYHPDVATSLNNLALLYYEEGKYGEAEPLYKRSLEIRRKIYGEYHPDVATSLNNLALLYYEESKYGEAEPLYKQALEIIKKIHGEYHPDVATSLNNLALLYYEEGKYDEAEPLYKRSLEIRRKIYGEYHPDVASSLNNLAELYLKKGRYDESEPLYKQSLEIRRKIYGEYHPDVAQSLNNLAGLYYEEGKYGEAEPLYKQALEIIKKIYGEYHPDVASSLNNLAELYLKKGRYDEAEPLYKQALEIRRKIYGEYHPDVATSLNNLAGLYLKKGRYDEAEPLYKQALEIRRKIYGEYHPNVATSLNNLAALYYEKGRYDEAEPLFKQSLEIIKKIYGEYHPSVATSLNNLAELYLKKGRYDESEPLYKQSLEIRRKIYGEYHPDVAQSLNNLAGLYYEEGKYGEAEPLLKQSLEIRRKIHGEYHPDVAQSLNNLAALYDEEGRYDEAEPLYKQALEILRKIYGENHPYIATSLNNLAELYRKEGKYNEAEPLYKQALEITRKIFGENDFRVASIFFELGTLIIARIIEEKNPIYCNEARSYLTKARELFLRLNYEDPIEKTNYFLKKLGELCPK